MVDLNRIQVVGCQYADLKGAIWGDADGIAQEPNRTTQPISVIKDPSRPYNLFLMFPQTASNYVEAQFVSATWYDPNRIGVLVRSSADKPWKRLGIVPQDQLQPPINQIVKAKIYTQSLVYNRSENRATSVRVEIRVFV